MTSSSGFLATAAEDIPAGALVGIDHATGQLRQVGDAPVRGIRPDEGAASPARDHLQANLDDLENELARADLEVRDVTESRDAIAVRVELARLALAELDLLEAAARRGDPTEGDPHR